MQRSHIKKSIYRSINFMRYNMAYVKGKIYPDCQSMQKSYTLYMNRLYMN